MLGRVVALSSNKQTEFLRTRGMRREEERGGREGVEKTNKGRPAPSNRRRGKKKSESGFFLSAPFSVHHGA